MGNFEVGEPKTVGANLKLDKTWGQGQKRRTSERRKKRLPVPSDDLPPLGRPIGTTAYGVVVITEITGELVDQNEVSEHHPDVSDEHVWAGWRLPTLEELVQTWPARHEPSEYEKARGWWQPTLIELWEARRQAKSRDRRRRKNQGVEGYQDRQM
jgi:hypothetical protein